MTSIPCDIVLLPSDELAQRLIALSGQLEADHTLFTLDGQNYFPHASLYMTQLKLEDIDKVKSILTDIAASRSVVDLSATRYYQALGYLDAEYARTDELDRLQMAVIDAVNPIRDGMREKDKPRMLEATGVAKANFEKYGYNYVDELFRPHASITRFADEEGIDAAKLPDVSQFSGQFVGIGVFEMGDNGTCVRELASVMLR
jgi:hypothetical protein